MKIFVKTITYGLIALGLTTISMSVNADVHKLPVKIEVICGVPGTGMFSPDGLLPAVRDGEGQPDDAEFQFLNASSDKAHPATEFSLKAPSRVKISFGEDGRYFFADGLKMANGETVNTVLGPVMLDEEGRIRLGQILGGKSRKAMGIRNAGIKGSGISAVLLLDEAGAAMFQQAGMK